MSFIKLLKLYQNSDICFDQVGAHWIAAIGAYALYLDDLFTAPAARGTGASTALLHRLAEIARDEDAVLVRWITAADNETARRIYDREATQTPWVTYDLKPARA